MAILDWEGFDRETANLNIFSSSNWNISSDGEGVGNYGRYAWASIGTMVRASAFPEIQQGYWQAHLWFADLPTNVGLHIRATLGGSEQVSVRFAPNSQIIQIWRGSTKLAESTTKYPVNSWFFCQILFDVATSGGNVEVWINGHSVIAVTGNTANTGSPNWNGWTLYYNNSQQGRVDNVLVYSTTGDPPTTRTPETRIYDSLPNGAGSTTQWTPSAGDNWQCVDEQPSNGDTDYVSAATAGLTDTYAAPAAAAPGSIIYAVGVHTTARKDDAGTNEIDGVLRSGGVDYAHGTPAGIGTSYARYRWLWHTDPATGLPWTVAGANAAQPGIRRTT